MMERNEREEDIKVTDLGVAAAGMAQRVLKHLGLFKDGKVTDSLLGRLSRWLWSWLHR